MHRCPCDDDAKVLCYFSYFFYFWMQLHYISAKMNGYLALLQTSTKLKIPINAAGNSAWEIGVFSSKIVFLLGYF